MFSSYRNIMFAALAVGILAAGVASIEPSAAASAGFVAMAMVTIKAPITLFYEGQYVAPGTPVSLPQAEADALETAHGVFGGGPANMDPGNTQMRNVDLASIKALNDHARINGKHGKGGPKGVSEGGNVDVDQVADLGEMTKPELQAAAKAEGVALEANDTKAEIIDKIEAARAAKEA